MTNPANEHHVSAARLQELRAQARYARERYDLYRARAYGSRPTSPSRMRELERECDRAETALRSATADAHNDSGS